ncbi:competence type IV pilus minor pilin ComGG [Bacillus suaedaesalsae]|uniref:Competence protein ComGG n=1 Tax=Bacillus suaedaesalsae TaxID=2810349 RepID=A0ABS2DFS3_9BACI|nr:competence type IV pilus minor pilin ComGG [Bacillus suaedaesalsae]MBM6617305.1 hypothetical protein [Bacillus suaedaesalsae]
MSVKSTHGQTTLYNQRGYVLPLVLMVSTLLLFILAHQLSLYVTESKFYNESSEIYKMDLILQKVTKDLKDVVADPSLKSKVYQFKEGSALLSMNYDNPSIIQVQIKVETKNNRKSSVLVHYDPVNNKITKWIEGR